MNPIAITGYALCNALGTSRDEVAAALRRGTSGLRPARVDVPFSTYAGAVPGELPELPEALKPWSTRGTKIAHLLLQQLSGPLAALRERWAPDRIAIVLGTSTAGADRTEAAYKDYVRTGALPRDYDLWRHHTYGATLEVVRRLSGAEGPSWMISTACTSGAKPFGSAARMIEAGIVDAAIVGGIDTLCSMTLQGFHSLGALSSEPTRPFSTERKGISIGEGGALLLLERDTNSNAWLCGVGESSDAYHIAAPHPEGAGAELAMRRALQDAAQEPSSIDFIQAHGTGTRLNDSAESKAIARLFPHAPPVVSTKGYTGHTLGAAGAVEAALTLLSLEEGWLPSSLGADPLDTELEASVSTHYREGKFRYALSNSFAFGGNNISLLLHVGGV